MVVTPRKAETRVGRMLPTHGVTQVGFFVFLQNEKAELNQGLGNKDKNLTEPLLHTTPYM